jgi:hypothetical protein
MGTIPSRFLYDVVARNAFQLAGPRCSAIQRYASPPLASLQLNGDHIHESPVLLKPIIKYVSNRVYV